jgi:biopolymer transport protein ExbB
MVEVAALALSIALAAQQPAPGVTPEAPPAADAASQPLGTEVPAPGAVPIEPAPADAIEPVAEETGAPAGPAATEEVENPYDLRHLIKNGDIVARGTLAILVIMSLGSWYIMLTKVWDQSRMRRQFLQTEKGFWSGRNLQEGISTLKASDNIFRTIAEQGMNAAKHHEGRLTDQIPLHEWITQSLQRAVDNVNNQLQGGLSFLATVGSTAPFVGLFGTVWGIYHALIAIGIAGQASIDRVAGPVGEALIMTAIGLAVAVPAVLGYNWLLRRNKAILEQVRYFATDVQAYLVSGARVEAAGAAPAVAQRSK